MAALALERAVLTGETFATDLVRTVDTVAVVIASITSWNAFTVRSAPEFGGGTFAILVATEFVIFVVSVGAIVFEITSPTSWNATFVLALEFGRLVAFRALFGQLIRS